MYYRGIERLQTRLSLLPSTLYFHYPRMKKWKHKVFAYDTDKGSVLEPVTLPDDLEVDLHLTSVIQVKNSLLLFKQGKSVLVSKLDNLGTGLVTATSLPQLDREAKWFAVANYNN